MIAYHDDDDDDDYDDDNADEDDGDHHHNRHYHHNNEEPTLTNRNAVFTNKVNTSYVTHDGDIEFRTVTNNFRYSILGLYASSLFTFTNTKEHSDALYT